jgi:hypothetical protein
MHPLEIAARLAQEDFNILIKDGNGEHRLMASATLFPAGWRLPERIGWTITQLHAPVPGFKEKLTQHVDHYLSRLSSANTMERSTYFIQLAPRQQDLKTTLFVQDPKDFYHGPHLVENVIMRKEKQFFRRLPSGAVLFTVRTIVQRLTDLRMAELHRLAVEIMSWSEEVRMYKGADKWGETVVGYVDPTLIDKFRRGGVS